jgi:hypothetical protein
MRPLSFNSSSIDSAFKEVIHCKFFPALQYVLGTMENRDSKVTPLSMTFKKTITQPLMSLPLCAGYAKHHEKYLHQV